MGLARLVVSFMELLEAEVRALGAGLLDLKIASVLAWVAGCLVLAGFLLVISGVFFTLRRGMTGPAALVATGLITLAFSGGLLWGARKIVRRA
jgi:hypothetical protein